MSPTGHFSWRNNNVSWYKPFTHQHLGEIGETLGAPKMYFLPQNMMQFEQLQLDRVMAEEPELRRNRMSLLNAIATLPKGIVDFTELPGF